MHASIPVEAAPATASLGWILDDGGFVGMGFLDVSAAADSDAGGCNQRKSRRPTDCLLYCP
jgi:hypothetical protein